MQQSVVAAGPEHAALDRRFGEREDRAVVLGAGVVLGDRSAGWPELRFVVPREVRADPFPRRALVGRAEDVIARVIQNVRIVRRMDGRRGPLNAVLHVLRAFARARLGPDHDVPGLPGAAVVTREQPLVVTGEDHVRIVRALLRASRKHDDRCRYRCEDVPT